MQKNSFSARAPLWELTAGGAYSSPLAGFKGPTSRGGTDEAKGRGKEGEGKGEGKWGEERERGIPVLLFPHFEPWFFLKSCSRGTFIKTVTLMNERTNNTADHNGGNNENLKRRKPQLPSFQKG